MLATVGLTVLLTTGAGAPRSWSIEASPVDAGEHALRACLDAERASPSATPTCLAAVSDRHPGTVASGLARLEAGLRLLAEERALEALAHLSHADIPRTRLRDRALLAAGEAQDALERPDAAARSYLAAASEPGGAVACAALPRAAEAFRRASQNDAAADALDEVVARCPRAAPRALVTLGDVHLARGDRRSAAAALDRLDRDHPASVEAREARPRLRELSTLLSRPSASETAERRLRKGEALLEANRSAEALDVLRTVELQALAADERDHARLLLGRAALARRRTTEGRAALARIAPESPHAAEAAFRLARDEASRRGSAEPYRRVADAFPGTPWAEEALFAAGNHHQKDALDDEALPWYRRLLAEFPDGRYAETAAWRVGWADYRMKRFEAAAYTLERAARLRPPSRWTPAFLYWAGRARLALAQHARAQHLLAETIQRYKHAYHGLRAQEALGRLGLDGVAFGPVVEATAPPEEVPAGAVQRVRELLLIDRLDAAAEELERLGDSTLVRATLAWVEWRRGRFLPAIVTMKRAYPEWVSAAGDRLPEDIWRIMFPIRYEEELRRQAARKGLDASLVAAVILQESSFDPTALSRSGARGIMQVMPATGLSIARAKGLSFRRAALHDPKTSLDFGTHYLRQMSDRFDGSVEKVLAAYNAGPHRVDAWRSLRPGLSGEEFIESIPFTETRQYVMLVLANREHYRRLYRLDRTTPGPVKEGPRP